MTDTSRLSFSRGGDGTLSANFNQAGTATLSASNTNTGTTTVAGGVAAMSRYSVGSSSPPVAI